MNEIEKQDIIESTLEKYYDLYPIFYKDGFALHWLFTCSLNVDNLYPNLIRGTSNLINLLEQWRKRFIIDKYGEEVWYRYLKEGGIMKHDPNPVRFEDNKWWFWNETWSYREGPYETEKEATDACAEYCKRELDGH